MSRKKSIPDRQKAGRSRIIPYQPGERHARRLKANVEQQAKLRRWCEKRGWTLRIANEGHHWQMLARRNSLS